jgi:spore coat protein U-like protein
MRISKLLFVLATTGVVAVSSDSRVEAAGSAQTNLPVNVTVIPNCTIITTAVAFPSYDPLAATNDDTSSGAVTVACTKGVSAWIGLNFGQNAAASPRAMKSSAGDLLPYDLYKDSPGGTVWGNTNTTGLTLTAAPSKAARPFPVHGRIASGQDVPAAAYSDTVVATVNF